MERDPAIFFFLSTVCRQFQRLGAGIQNIVGFLPQLTHQMILELRPSGQLGAGTEP